MRIESATMALVDRGVRAMVVRPSRINGPDNRGFVPACYRDDAARAYRLAIERGQAGHSYHAVAEQGIAMRDLATAIARG